MFWIIGGIVLIFAIFGPVGLLVAGGIVWWIIQSESAENERKKVVQQQSQQQSNQSLEIENLAPIIDILCIYALKYEPEWIPEKVRFIKRIFQEHLKTVDDETFLKERLKAQYRRPLPSLISAWLNQEPTLEDRQFISRMVTILMVQTCDDFDVAQQECLSFGTAIGLDEYECYIRFSELAREAGWYHQQYQNDEQESQSQEFKTKLELSAEILGISVHATREEIQKAYRLKIKEFHPDRNVNVTPTVKAMLEEQAHKINEARDILIENLG